MLAVDTLRDGKAGGPDEIPVEYWKAVLAEDDDVVSDWLLFICNSCLKNGAVPDDWHRHRVAISKNTRVACLESRCSEIPPSITHITSEIAVVRIQRAVAVPALLGHSAVLAS